MYLCKHNIFYNYREAKYKKRSSNNPTKHSHNIIFSMDVVKHALLQLFNYERHSHCLEEGICDEQ